MIIKSAKGFDLRRIHDTLREEDVEELRLASGGLPTMDSLRQSVELSTVSYVASSSDGPVILGGMTVADTNGVIWGVGTTLMHKYRRKIATMTRPVIEGWFRMFPQVNLMWNCSLASNTLHHRWLEWAGATLLEPAPMGPDGGLFVPFFIRRNDYV